MAVQIDRQRLASRMGDRRQHNPVDEAPDQLGRFRTPGLVGQRLAQAAHLGPVMRAHVGIHQHRRVLCAVKFAFENGLALFERGDPVLHLCSRHTVHDGLDQPVELARHLVELGPLAGQGGVVIHPDPVHVPGVFLAEDFTERRVHQVVLEPVEHRRFQLGALHGAPVVAGAALAGGRAADPLAVEIGEAAPADAAAREAREQVARPAAVPEAALTIAGAAREEFALAGLHLVPERLVDDPQIRHFFDDPFLAGIEARDALAALRVLDVTEPVPHQPADIELVVEDAGAALAVSVDGARPPGLAGGTGHTLAVQRDGDRARRPAGGIVVENAPHDGGLTLVDPALAAHGLAVVADPAHHVIAVGLAAAGFAGLDTPAQAAACLVGEVLKVEGVHRALEADMEMRDLTLREGHDLHAGERETLIERGDVRLIAREPVERLGDDDLELARQGIAHQRLHAGAHQRGARDPLIAVTLMDAPPFAGGAVLAEPDLVFDGSFALLIGGIAGVDGNRGHPESSLPPQGRSASLRSMREAS